MKRREFLATGAVATLGLGFNAPKVGVAQAPGGRKIARGKATTTRLFKSPGMYPNALAVAPEGLWIAQLKLSAQQAKNLGEPVPPDRDEAAWLVDWNGKLLKTIIAHSRTTSGLAYGNNCIWMGANSDPQGFFQIDMESKELRHLQIPLGQPENGGGCHGAQWHNGKLWIASNRMRGNLRVDPVTWTPELFLPIYTTPEQPSWHDLTFDKDGFLWQINGNDSASVGANSTGLVKYDPESGQVVQLVDFEPAQCDPHGLEYHDGAFISCDPGWRDLGSPYSGWVFRIDIA